MTYRRGNTVYLFGHPLDGAGRRALFLQDAFVYGVSPDIVLCRAVDAPPVAEVTTAGHINEGDDLFGTGVAMPDVREGVASLREKRAPNFTGPAAE